MTVDFDSFFALVSESPGHEGVPEITPEAIKRRQCACCGRPAKVSFHDLKRHERILLCNDCRPPAPPSAPTTSTPE